MPTVAFLSLCRTTLPAAALPLARAAGSRRRGALAADRAQPSLSSLSHLLLGVLLAILSACAPDTATAPLAAPGGARAYRTSTPSAYAQVTAGILHACAVTTGGTVACWGNQRSLTGLSGVTQVTAGFDFTCALRTNGTVTCGGDGYFGQTSVPAGLSGVTQVSAGMQHACAVSIGGTVTCWGRNSFGGQTDVPPGLSGVTQVSAAGYQTCALTTGGAVTCWGTNGYGQTNVPAGLSGVTQVSAGGEHTCALRTGGAVTCWGRNSYGQTSVPSGLRGLTQVSAGDEHTCALSAGGAVTCWGQNDYGQTSVPAGLGELAQVAAGGSRTCVLSTGGAVTCWGQAGAAQETVPAPPPTTTRVYPTATFTAPATATIGQSVPLALTGAQVPGYPAATAFSYQFDCGTGAYGAASPSATASCPTSTAGTLAVRGRVTDQDGDTASYAASVTVTKAAQNVAFTSGAPSPAYVGASYTASAAATSSLPVTLTSRTPTTCTVTAPAAVRFVAAGPCTLAADQAGDGTYAAAPTALQSVIITKAAQTVAFTSTAPSPAVVGASYPVSATGGASGQPVVVSTLTPATCTVAGSTVSFTAAGACTLAADQAGTDAYNPAPRQTQAITITVAFPRTPVLDRFARANGALGSAWGGFTATAFFQVTSQQGAVGFGGGIGWAATAFGATQEAFVSLSALGSGSPAGSAQGLVLKGQDPRDHTLGALTITYQPQAGTVQVAALRAPPLAATLYPVLAVRFAAGDQLGARATAAGAVEVYRNGTLVGTVPLNAADRAYFAGRGGYVGLVYVNATGARFDDFGGGTGAP